MARSWDQAGESLSGEAALERVAAISRRLAEADDLDQTLQRVVDFAEGYIDPCGGATMMLVGRGGRVTTPAASNLDARRADLAQYEAGEGPCLSAMREHETVVIEDIEAEARWPRWREEVASLGWRSMIGLRLFVAEDTMGALDLYCRRPDGFGRHSQALGQVFASHAAVAMKSAIAVTGLERALASRDIIGQAKGILMERERLSGEQAFRRIKDLSTQRNVKVVDVARDIAETGDVPN